MDDELWAKLRVLLLGLADQEIAKGAEFSYGGGKLLAEDVAEIGLGSVLCIADRISHACNMGGVGFSFTLSDELHPVFPLAVEALAERPSFTQVAPFVAKAFDTTVMDYRHDLALVFEEAAQHLRASYSLDTETDYEAQRVPPGGDVSGRPGDVALAGSPRP